MNLKSPLTSYSAGNVWQAMRVLQEFWVGKGHLILVKEIPFVPQNGSQSLCRQQQKCSSMFSNSDGLGRIGYTLAVYQYGLAHAGPRQCFRHGECGT